MVRQVAKPISRFVRDNDSSSVKLSTNDLGGSGSPPPMSLFEVYGLNVRDWADADVREMERSKMKKGNANEPFQRICGLLRFVSHVNAYI